MRFTLWTIRCYVYTSGNLVRGLGSGWDVSLICVWVAFTRNPFIVVSSIILLPTWTWYTRCMVHACDKNTQAVFLYCYPHCPSCQANAIQLYLATWTIGAAVKKYTLIEHKKNIILGYCSSVKCVIYIRYCCQTIVVYCYKKGFFANIIVIKKSPKCNLYLCVLFSNSKIQGVWKPLYVICCSLLIYSYLPNHCCRFTEFVVCYVVIFMIVNKAQQ